MKKKYFKLLAQHLIFYIYWFLISIIYQFKLKNKKYYIIDNCDIYFINLSHRIDRLDQLKNEFKRLNIKEPIRFNAIYNKNGALGCSLSHKGIYELLLKTKNLTLICEDDIEFHCSKEQLDFIINAFYNDTRLDVLCLGHFSNYKFSINKNFFITTNTQTTSCYILKPHMIYKFLNIANYSISGLSKNINSENIFAIDQVWKKLQLQNVFVVPKIKCVVQRKSFSDIQNNVVDYGV